MSAAPHTGEDSPSLHEGVLVADKYRLVDPAGEGAMGTVWRAIHITLGSTVAIKFLHGSVAKAAEPRARFEREAKLAARLGEASLHITKVNDHGVMPDGTPFLVMEMLEGEGLEVRLKRERRLPLALVAKITSQLARALHVAHVAGVIHRDLKPANVFLCNARDDGDLHVKLLDFGVAKATLDQDENQATRAGALIGTPNYMSPEQISDGTVDIRSDLWALAAIVYRMSVGRAPFGSGSLSELAMRIMSTEPPTPTQLAPDLPHEFDLFTTKGLAKNAAQRFQSARELADSLAMVAGVSATGHTGTFSAAAAERIAMQLGDSVGALHTPAAPLSEPPPKKRRAGVIGVALTLVVAAIVSGVFYAQKQREPAAAAQPATKPDARAEKVEPAKVDPPKPAVAASSPQPESLDDAPSPSASTPPTASTATAAAKKGVYVAPPTKKTAQTPTAEPTATAPPPPPPPPEKKDNSGDLWKKKDEM